jgi:hypothetical protein
MMAQTTVELGMLLDRTNFELFDFEYQIDDPNFKAQLEQAIIDFYYDYEIGFETPDMFKRKFKARWLREIAFFNKLYNTTLLSYNPLINSKVTEALEQLSTTQSQQDSELTNSANGKTTNIGTSTINQDVIGNSAADSTTTNNLTATTDGTTDSKSTTNQTSNEKTSDYPQQSIAGGDYLNGARMSDGDTTTDNSTTNNQTTRNTGTVVNASTGTDDTHTEGTTTTDNETISTDSGTSVGVTSGTGSTNTDYTKTIEGLTGTTYQELITKERQNILRISDMVINQMKPCFILVC